MRVAFAVACLEAKLVPDPTAAFSTELPDECDRAPHVSCASGSVETFGKRMFIRGMRRMTSEGPGGAVPGRSGISRQRKTAAFPEPWPSEDPKTVARGLGVTAATLMGWRDAFLSADEASLATRHRDVEDSNSGRLSARPGDMLPNTELLAARIMVLEKRRPPSRRRSRPCGWRRPPQATDSTVSPWCAECGGSRAPRSIAGASRADAGSGPAGAHPRRARC